MIRIHSFCAEEKGVRLVVLGAVHGNEACGPDAVARAMAAFESGAIKLLRGQVCFVPVCNPQAYEQHRRFIDRNLNRHLVYHEEPDCYEAKLGNILVPLLQGADVLLDLHSSPRASEPYVFVGPGDQLELAYAATLGPRTLVNGWEETYAAVGRPDSSGAATAGIGTEQVVRAHGGRAALVECGAHDDPAAVDVAFAAIQGALQFWGLIQGAAAKKERAPRLVTCSHVFYKDGEGAFTRDWQDFDPVRAGEAVARFENGESLVAPADGLVILPDPKAGIGQEWFGFGKENPLALMHYEEEPAPVLRRAIS